MLCYISTGLQHAFCSQSFSDYNLITFKHLERYYYRPNRLNIIKISSVIDLSVRHAEITVFQRYDLLFSCKPYRIMRGCRGKPYRCWRNDSYGIACMPSVVKRLKSILFINLTKYQYIFLKSIKKIFQSFTECRGAPMNND